MIEGTEEVGYVDATPDLEFALREAGQVGSREQIEHEIDEMLRGIRRFYKLEPDEVMVEASALTARCTELYVHLHRIEGRFRDYRQIRTQQIVPLLEELDRQYKVASRLVEVRRQDWEQSR